MRKFAMFGIFVLGTLIAGMALAQSPQQLKPTPSLGDLAKRLRAERSKETQKPAKVYTNDNLPRGRDLSESISEGASPEGKQEIKGEAKGETSTATGAGASSDAHDEQYFREKMKELQATKEMHERELAVLGQKLNLNETQYYGDPNKTLNQEFSRSDINQKQGEIEKKKQQISEDEKAIADLQAQCQREGCPPAWLR